jgi:hypothetical protein
VKQLYFIKELPELFSRVPCSNAGNMPYDLSRVQPALEFELNAQLSYTSKTSNLLARY